MDVTPQIPEGRQVIETYGDGRFRISGRVYEGSVIVFPERALNWPVARFQELSADSLSEITAAADALDVVLLGCGQKMGLVPREIRESLRQAGVVIEPMDTGAAARTYNVLMAEERRVAAALIAVE
ncbi:MAG: Mth938-like domain-containing protein [Rhodovibrionaceae bacterium]|nr:Mth938-like domain-containing protein [Rhodovibrionaceae bacterium]